MSMEGEFRTHHESTWHQSFSTISLICALFSPRFWYVIAETMGYQNGVLCFSIRCWDHIEIFNRKLKLKIFEGIIRWCVRSIRIIRWYVTKSTYHLLISSRFLFIYLFIYSSSNLFAGYLKTEKRHCHEFFNDDRS